MHRELKFNICGLNDSSVLNKDILDLDKRISDSISPQLRYSALFWMTHVASAFERGADTSDEVIRLVKGLICHRQVLFWLEVLSLIGHIERGIDILRRCSRHFAVSASNEKQD